MSYDFLDFSFTGLHVCVSWFVAAELLSISFSDKQWEGNFVLDVNLIKLEMNCPMFSNSFKIKI